MSLRRVVVSGVGAAAVALLLSACGSSPLLPPVVGLSSPYQGSSSADPLSQTGGQSAKVRVCSLAGGPLAVDVHIPAADVHTELHVRAYSTDIDANPDLEAARLIEEHFLDGSSGVDVHVVSERPLRPGECADVMLGSSQFFFDPGYPFTFTITW